MSKFMKAVDSYENSFDYSVIEEQDREVKSLFFESLVLTESMEIGYPVLEGEFTERIKNVASNIWEAIVKLFNTITETISGWINRLKALFNKRKADEAKAKSNTAKPEENKKEDAKPTTSSDEKKEEAKPAASSDEKKEEAIKAEEPAKEEPAENSAPKYIKELEIRLQNCVNVFDGSFNTSGYINDILQYINKIHTDVKKMYNDIENVTDNDIANAEKQNEDKSKNVQKTLNKAIKDEVVFTINMDNALEYINKLGPVRDAFRLATNKLKSLGEMSSHSFFEAKKKDESKADRVSSIVTKVLEWVRKVITPVHKTLGSVLGKIAKFLNPRS